MAKVADHIRKRPGTPKGKNDGRVSAVPAAVLKSEEGPSHGGWQDTSPSRLQPQPGHRRRSRSKGPRRPRQPAPRRNPPARVAAGGCRMIRRGRARVAGPKPDAAVRGGGRSAACRLCAAPCIITPRVSDLAPPRTFRSLAGELNCAANYSPGNVLMPQLRR